MSKEEILVDGRRRRRERVKEEGREREDEGRAE